MSPQYQNPSSHGHHINPSGPPPLIQEEDEGSYAVSDDLNPTNTSRVSPNFLPEHRPSRRVQRMMLDTYEDTILNSNHYRTDHIVASNDPIITFTNKNKKPLPREQILTPFLTVSHDLVGVFNHYKQVSS